MYIEKKLTEGEEIIYVAKLHKIEYLRWVICTLIVAAILYAIYRSNILPVEIAQYQGVVWVVIAAIFLLSFIATFMRRFTTEVVITNQRFALKKGIVAIDRDGMPLNKIENIKANQSVLGRILRYGHVEIRGSGDTSLMTPLISKPMDFRDALAAIMSNQREMK